MKDKLIIFLCVMLIIYSVIPRAFARGGMPQPSPRPETENNSRKNSRNVGKILTNKEGTSVNSADVGQGSVSTIDDITAENPET